MKKLSSTMKKIVTLMLVVVLAFSVIACNDENESSSSINDNSSSDSSSEIVVTPAVSISLTSDKDSIRVGEEANLTVVVENSDNTEYEWSVSENGKDIVQIADNVLSVREGAEIKFDTAVTVTATAKADKNARASKTITIIAPIVEGRVGDLTSEMIEAIGNPSITVTGTLTDVYFNNYQSYLNSETVYDMAVEMENGKWKGSWKVQGDDSFITDSYRKGSKDGVKDYNGNIGHQMEKIYINKNNEVSVSAVKDYMSYSAIWESQHLWNHLSNLNVNDFTYDAESGLYSYKVDPKDEASLYLMTYLSYSLTPLLADTLVEIAFTVDVELGAITSLIGKTERIYEGLDEQSGEFDAYYDTIINLQFSNVGSTTVSDPEAYAAPMNANVLEGALNEMKGATNYTFNIEDNTIYAASGDGSDYEMYGVNVGNTASGKVGTIGYVTEDKILIHETGKYSYSIDDKLYHHSYRGYVQNDDNTYDYFENKGSVLTGKRKYTGNMLDAMPGFDFSVNVFKFAGMETVAVGNGYQNLYKFVLRENSITREVGMELCIDGKDAAALATAKLTIWVIVDNQGNAHVQKASVPYDLVSGTWTGTYDITYGRIGSTTIDDSFFVDYVPRTIPTTWADTETMYYQINFTGNTFNENTQTVMEACYGDAVDSIPSPTLFFEAFGDSLSGPFYDWKETSKVDADGNAIKMGWVSTNLTVNESYLDENDRIENFDALVAHMDEVFAKYGFARSVANTDITGGESGKAPKYITYTNDEIMVVIENIGTKYLYVDFYKLGDWSLNR
ncbi:MAG: hypothetical protein E7339_05305 [Clostridiales bacterium]|nr:hypothetical protein [Clostridiales bacterium]